MVTSRAEFNKVLKQLAKANEKYKNLLFKAEKIFVERYGYLPSEVDFDSWIDFYHVGTGFLSAEEIEEEINMTNTGLSIHQKKEKNMQKK